MHCCKCQMLYANLRFNLNNISDYMLQSAPLQNNVFHEIEIMKKFGYGVQKIL